MRNRVQRQFAILVTTSSIAIAACGRGGDARTTNSGGEVATPATAGTTPVVTDTAATHHSKLAGAAVGAAAGHVLGGHAVAGAAVGALIQHERNKHGK